MATRNTQNENTIQAAPAASRPTTPFLQFCCAITFTDASALRECNSEQMERTIILRALAALVMLSTTIPLWTLMPLVMLELPLWAALPAGTLIGLLIFLLDTAITRGDWEPKGILAESGFGATCLWLCRALLKTMVRLPFAFASSLLTGTFVTLMLFHGSLENQIEKNRQQYNAPIEAEYQVARKKLHADVIGSVQNDHHMLTQERQKLLDQQQQQRRDQQQQENAASQARITKNKELESGEGPKFRHAKTQEEEAQRHVALSQQALTQSETRLATLEHQLQAADARIQAAQDRFEKANGQLIAERDAKLLPARSDILMKVQALRQMMKDEIFGDTVTSTTSVIEFFLITIEMVIFITAFFEPPSLLTKTLRERTHTQAHQIELNHALTEYNLDTELKYRKLLSERQYELQYQADLRTLDANYTGAAIPALTADERLFEVPAEEISQPDAEQTTCSEPPAAPQPDERYPVIGSETQELISIAQAQANPERYWVNPDNPTEIWLQAHRQQIFN